MINFRRALLALSALLTAVAIILISWAAWPSKTKSQITHLHLIAAAELGNIPVDQVTAHIFDMTLTRPDIIKIGQMGNFQVILNGLPSSVIVDGIRFQLRVRAELILAGFVNQQDGMIAQNVQPGKPVLFIWNVRATQPLNSSGVIRIYVDYVSPSGTEIAQLISATDLELTSKDLLGLSTLSAISLSVVLILVAGLAGGLGVSKLKTN